MNTKMKQIEKIKSEIKNTLETIESVKELTELKVTYLGKKGPINELSQSMKELSNEDKKVFGKALNDFKMEITELIQTKEQTLKQKELEEKLEQEKIDITLPATKLTVGTMHPLIRTVEEIENIFISMGYDVVE